MEKLLTDFADKDSYQLLESTVVNISVLSGGFYKSCLYKTDTNEELCYVGFRLQKWFQIISHQVFFLYADGYKRPGYHQCCHRMLHSA